MSIYLYNIPTSPLYTEHTVHVHIRRMYVNSNYIEILSTLLGTYLSSEGKYYYALAEGI